MKQQNDASTTELGVQPQQGDRLQCLECGRWFKAMGSHLDRAHGLTAEEYRQRWGLTTRHPLASEASRRRWTAAAQQQLPQKPRAARAFREQATTKRIARIGPLSEEARVRIAESARRPEVRRRLAEHSEQQKQETLARYDRAAQELGYPSLRAALEATLNESCQAAAQRLGWSQQAVRRLRSQLDLAHPTPRLTPQQRRKAVDAVVAGEEAENVAKRVGLSVDRLYYWVRKLRPDWQRQPGPADNGHAAGTLRARMRPESVRRQAAAEVDAGDSFAAVGRKYGVSDVTVRNWWKRYGRERRGLLGS